jgi:AraC-like DNA-binding protein
MDDHRTDIDQVFLQQLTDITEENLTNEHFNVEDLARNMGMSYTKLYRKIRGLTHQTVSQFIREIRLKKAYDILLNEEVTASEVSYRTGFGSPTYFSKCFHEYYGYSPLEFKKHQLRKRNNHFSRWILLMKRKINQLVILVVLALIVLFVFLLFMSHTIEPTAKKFPALKEFSSTGPGI